MSEVKEEYVRCQAALDSIKLIQASAVLDLTEDDCDFLTSNKGWMATERACTRRWVQARVKATPHYSAAPCDVDKRQGTHGAHPLTYPAHMGHIPRTDTCTHL